MQQPLTLTGPMGSNAEQVTTLLVTLYFALPVSLGSSTADQCFTF